MPPEPSLGSRLNDLRTLSGLGSRQLARLAQGIAKLSDPTATVSEGAISALERADNARLSTVTPIVEVLGTTLDYLATGAGEPPTKEQILVAVAAARARLGIDGDDEPAPTAQPSTPPGE